MSEISEKAEVMLRALCSAVEAEDGSLERDNESNKKFQAVWHYIATLEANQRPEAVEINFASLSDSGWYTCPACGCENIHVAYEDFSMKIAWTPSYCPSCGTPIIWEENDDQT